jgi:hypothetical protein
MPIIFFKVINYLGREPPFETFHVVGAQILQAGAKWWTPDQRRKFEGKLKTRIVLVDIKVHS